MSFPHFNNSGIHSTDALYASVQDLWSMERRLQDLLGKRGYVGGITDTMTETFTFKRGGYTADPDVISFDYNFAHKIACNSIDDDDMERRLLHHFWGYQNQDKSTLPTGSNAGREVQYRDPKTCSHDWQDVILFHTSHQRCKWCDVKKADVDSGKLASQS